MRVQTGTEYQEFHCTPAAPNRARSAGRRYKPKTDKTEGCAAIQRDFDSLEKPAKEQHQVQPREMPSLALGEE